jgi:hypothetical protein
VPWRTGGRADTGAGADGFGRRLRLLDRGEIRGRSELEHLEIVGARGQLVQDAGRLVHAVAGTQQELALALVPELDPALEHIDELEVEPVQMPSRAVLAGQGGTDDVRADPAAGRRFDAEIPIDEVGPQPVALEIGLVQPTHAELVDLPRTLDRLGAALACARFGHDRVPSQDSCEL